MEGSEHKYSRLLDLIRPLGRVVVAFSGGVDSSLLLKASLECLLPEEILAVTVQSPFSLPGEVESAGALAGELGTPWRAVEVDELQDLQIVANTPYRCYHCKEKRFSLLTALARQEGYRAVLEGTNQSDAADFRPGTVALREMPLVHSPLQECGLTKEEIRELARDLGLRNWNQPSQACLASRLPYGEPLTGEKLHQVSRAEEELKRLGFRRFRVRYHGPVARIEISPEELPRVWKEGLMETISRRVKSCGFAYAALDLDGYRSGSLNETVDNKEFFPSTQISD